MSGATGSSYVLASTSGARDNGAHFDVVVSNGYGAVTSPVATLTVLCPPDASNLILTLPADLPSNLTLLATETNCGPLTFLLRSAPTNGLLSAFNPTTGRVTYTPAHGFSGRDNFDYTVTDGVVTSLTAVVILTVIPPVDSDGNGLPDPWEIAHGLIDPDGDPDHDGMANLDEYLANTNPLDANSCFRVLQITRPGQNVCVVTWSSVGGTRYRISYSDGDAHGGYSGQFTPIVRSVSLEIDPAPYGTGSTQSFTDDSSLTGGPPVRGSRYYRVEAIR
jgi:hypothetical protein